ncbi:MAG: class I SAM-dependent methyltransferase [Myxococcota bacterium]
MTESVATEVVVCPDCREGLELTEASVGCLTCGWRRSRAQGYLPLDLGVGQARRGLGPRAMYWRPLAKIYERVWRPTFVAIASRRRPDLEAEQVWIETHLLRAAGGDIADLSCGPGLMARRFARSGAYRRVYGVDLSPAMLEACVTSCRQEMLPVFALQADVVRLPFRGRSLAGVHAGAALHLWADPLAALVEVGRVLRPGGTFVASTFVHPRRYGPRHLIEDAFEHLSEVRFYGHDELEGLCAAAGLVDFQARRQGAWILFTARAVR